MTVVAVVFGVVALVSIAINIRFRVLLDKEVANGISLKADKDMLEKSLSEWKQKASDWKDECIKADKKLTDANANLKKWHRNRDPKTGKIVKG
jgi:hypothetical protein